MFEIRKIQEEVLFKAVQTAKDDATASYIVYGESGQAASENDPAWVKSAMHRLESQFDEPSVKQIRMQCQCGYAMDEKLALVKGLVDSSSNLDEFASQDTAKAAGLFCEGGELYLQFPFCPCPILAEVERLETYTWCQCTAGYSKVLFEQAFGCAVDVELLTSIKAGDDRCLMKIIPQGVIWK